MFKPGALGIYECWCNKPDCWANGLIEVIDFDKDEECYRVQMLNGLSFNSKVKWLYLEQHNFKLLNLNDV